MDIVAVIIILLLLVAGPVVVVNRDLLFNRSAAKRASSSEVPLPFLIIPSFPGASDTVPAGVSWARTGNLPPAATEPAAPRAAAEPVPTRSPNEKWAPTPEPPIDLDDEPSPDATVVFNRPVDVPVQILPGRLQVLSGEGSGQDLRLFSMLGETPQIVVGRETGPPHRYITLRSPTVSRRHARMDFLNGHWTITNLSLTNPVLVNDRALSNGGSTRMLTDGDRIELGEVALRFRAS